MTKSYSDLDYDDDDESLIDYDAVSTYAKAGLKNPRMIAHAMGLPVEWFEETYKEEVELAIERGLAQLALETTDQIRRSAANGDFQAQKYIIQNIDDTWSDRKEVVEKKEFDFGELPALTELFKAGLPAPEETQEKEVNPPIEGEYQEK